MNKSDKEFDYEITLRGATEDISWSQFREYCHALDYCIEKLNGFFDDSSKKRVYSCLDSIVSWYKKIHNESGRFNYRECISRINRMLWNNTTDHEMLVKLLVYATRDKKEEYLINMYKKKYKIA